MNATKIDQRPKCCECGSYDVETTAWVAYRLDGTMEIVSGEGPFESEAGNWCHDCQEHVHLDYPDFTPEDLEAVAAAVRAREAGPELLKALAEIVGMAELDCLDEKSNVWRSAIMAANSAIAKAEGRGEK